MNRPRTLATGLLPLALIAGSPAAAQTESSWEDWPLADRWTVSAGYFAPDLETTVIVTDENQMVVGQ